MSKTLKCVLAFAVACIISSSYFIGACDNGECLHEFKRIERVDLSGFGFCGGYITFKTCKCGEAKIFDDDLISDFDFRCVNVESRVENGNPKNGQKTEKVINECTDCGMSLISEYLKNEPAACKTEYDGTTEMFDKSKKSLFRFGFKFKAVDHGDAPSIENNVDLKEYGACEGVIKYSCCSVCGDVLNTTNENAECILKPYTGSVKERKYTDNFGKNYNERIDACSVCGLKRYTTETRYENGCTEIERTEKRFEIGDRIIYKSKKDMTAAFHNFFYDYKQLGKKCADGVKVTKSCSKCGFVYAYEEKQHQDYEFCYADLTEKGFCNGEFAYYKCSACGENLGVNMQFAQIKYDTHEGWVFKRKENGYTVFGCETCFIEKYYKKTRTKTNPNDECTWSESVECFYQKDGETIFSFVVGPYIAGNHEYILNSFKLNGETCEDGGTVTIKCKKCGDEKSEQINPFSSHHTQYNVGIYDLSDLGGCFGNIYETACPCGKYTNLFLSGECELVSEPKNEIINGVKCLVEYEKCSVCGFERKTADYSVVEKCTTIKYRYVAYKMGEQTLVEKLNEKSRTKMHEYKIVECKLNGETCLDGYKLIYACSCGDGFERLVRKDNHSGVFKESYDLKNGGSLKISRCACGKKNELQIITCNHRPEFTRTTERTDGADYLIRNVKCEKCGYEYTENSTCDKPDYDIYYVISLVIDGKTVVDNVEFGSIF